MLDEFKPIHELQVYAVVLLAMTIALAVSVGAATYAVLLYASVS